MSDVKNNIGNDAENKSYDELLAQNESYKAFIETLKKQVSERDRDIRALQAECLRKDGELLRLTDSRGFRLLKKYYKIRETLLPNGSRRYMFVRNLLYPLIWLVKKSKKRKISFKVVDRDEGFRRMKYSERVGIIVTEHTRYIANIICDCLEKCGLKGEIHIDSVEKYEDIPYIIICPQFLKEFPRLYTVVQMEQTVSTRWMTQDYLNILRNAYAVFDYSMVNINYFSQDPAIASKLYYLPVDCSMKPIAEPYDGEKEYDVLRVFNCIFGSGTQSKLFMNVREKLSLCYHCSSRIYSKGVMMVTSGIEPANYDKARNEILAQLDEIRNGNISDEEMDSAKKRLRNSMLSVGDSAEAIHSWYVNNRIFGIEASPEELIAKIERVTKEEVAAAAKKVTLDTEYFLCGEEEGK
jgi:hypothetical protein